MNRRPFCVCVCVLFFLRFELGTGAAPKVFCRRASFTPASVCLALPTPPLRLLRLQHLLHFHFVHNRRLKTDHSSSQSTVLPFASFITSDIWRENEPTSNDSTRTDEKLKNKNKNKMDNDTDGSLWSTGSSQTRSFVGSFNSRRRNTSVSTCVCVYVCVAYKKGAPIKKYRRRPLFQNGNFSGEISNTQLLVMRSPFSCVFPTAF